MCHFCLPRHSSLSRCHSLASRNEASVHTLSESPQQSVAPRPSQPPTTPAGQQFIQLLSPCLLPCSCSLCLLQHSLPSQTLLAVGSISGSITHICSVYSCIYSVHTRITSKVHNTIIISRHITCHIHPQRYIGDSYQYLGLTFIPSPPPLHPSLGPTP